MVYLVCENKNRAKTANTNNGKYKFEYIDEKDVENLVNVPHGKTAGFVFKTQTDIRV